MARTNKLKLAASLIEAEIIGAKTELGKEVTSCNYGKASGWQERIAGLKQALSYIRVVDSDMLPTAKAVGFPVQRPV